MTPRNGFLADGAPPARAIIEFAKTFPKIPALVEQRTRCGKACCRCNRGDLHGPVVYLRWREGGRQRRRYVRRADVDAVRAVLERRRAERVRERIIVAEDLALLRRLERLRRELDATIAGEGRER
jgi:hypothetical protein